MPPKVEACGAGHLLVSAAMRAGTRSCLVIAHGVGLGGLRAGSGYESRYG